MKLNQFLSEIKSKLNNNYLDVKQFKVVTGQEISKLNEIPQRVLGGFSVSGIEISVMVVCFDLKETESTLFFRLFKFVYNGKCYAFYF